MQLIEDLKKKISKVLKKRQQAEPSDPVANTSFNESSHGKIYGFSRPAIAVAGLAFICAFAYAMFSSVDDYNADQDKGPVMSEIAEHQEISNMASHKGGNTYAAQMQAANEAKKGGPSEAELKAMAEKKAKEEELKKQQEAQRQQAAAQPAPRTVQPAIPQNSFNPNAAILAQQQALQRMQMEQAMKNSQPAPQKEEKGPNMGAAIDFINVGSGSDQSSGAGGSLAINSLSGYAPADRFTLSAGCVIPAMLLTGINTDIEGEVMAQICSDALDTLTGSNILIPAGSRLIGKYSSANTQSGRVGINFTTLVFPDGSSFNVGDAFAAIDGKGTSGIMGKVNNHYNRVITGGLIGGSIAALSSLAGGNIASGSTTYSAGQLATQGAVSSLINTTSSIINKAASANATVTVQPGYQFNIFVTKNISFAGMN